MNFKFATHTPKKVEFAALIDRISYKYISKSCLAFLMII
uniref:ABC transporter permease n=1 Tax=Ascaris lumbricoides TaxID=6252 RepID=A0A0M3IQK5_ASCLU